MANNIIINHVSKSFEDVRALNDISFRSSPGVNIILGPNGAGKSTLLRCIAGLYKPDSGSIRVLGKEPYYDNTLKQRMSFLSENYALYDYLSVKDNLIFFGKLYGMNEGEIIEKATETLKRLDAYEFIERKVYTLSRGTKQKIAFCRATLNDPEILLLDEPTAFLDQQSSEEIRKSVQEYERMHRTVLLVTQRINEVAHYNARLLILNKGRIVNDSKTTDIYKSMLSGSSISIRLAKPLKNSVAASISGFISSNGVSYGNMLRFKIRNYKEVNKIIASLIENGAYIVSIDYAEPLVENIFGKGARDEF